MEIKNLVFDLGGVILQDHFALAGKKIVEQYNVDLNKLVDAFHKHDLDIYHSGEAPYEQRIKASFEEIGRSDIDPKLIIDIIEEIFVPVPGMIELVEALKEKYSLYILSNQVEALLPKLERKYDFFKDFKYSVFSFRVGMAKPNPEIYQFLLDQTEIKPEESVFIDNMEANLVPARKLGLQTILFENAEQFQRDLVELVNR
jgi:HAD superfamily hydrolase (TIGR01509 family)